MLVASVLNIVSVIGFVVLLLFKLVKLDNFYPKSSFAFKFSLKTILYIFVFTYPYNLGKTNNVLKDYKILNKKHESNFVNAYTEFLNWILVVEGFSYKLYEKLK